MEKRYYIAYGSNLHKDQMRFRCPDAVPMGTAYLTGWRLVFRGSKTGSYLTIEKARGHKVPVTIWSVSPEDELRLDRYEGYPSFYRKLELPITYTGIDSGKERTRNCFVYVMRDGSPAGMPTRFYVNTCLQGYLDFHFSPLYLSKALDYTKELVKEARRNG